MMTDPIADMLTRIRNAQQARHEGVVVPASKLKKAVAEILVKRGYLAALESEGEGAKAHLKLQLRYVDNDPVIQEVKRISTPGRRVYVGKDEIPEVLGGMGLAILSTSKGVMSGDAAKAQQVGGEVLCTVY